MLRAVRVLVAALVASATLAAATFTDPVQQDPGTTPLDGDAGDDAANATPLVAGGPEFHGYGILVPADDPQDHYRIQLGPGEGTLGSLSVTVSPVGLDIQLVVLDARGIPWYAEPHGPGEPETVTIPYAMPGAYVVSVHDVTCGATGFPCAPEAYARVPLSAVAGDYALALACDPYC